MFQVMHVAIAIMNISVIELLANSYRMSSKIISYIASQLANYPRMDATV